MKRIIFALFSGCFLYSCADTKIVQPEDYNVYLQPAHLSSTVEKTNGEIRFWQQRLATDTGSYVALLELGYNYLGLFQAKGKISDLKTGDSLLQRAAEKLNHSDPDILNALSQVAITQHQFKKADVYNQQAFQNEGSPFVHALLSFDVGMELGLYGAAKGNLSVLKEPDSFDFLIRKAKYLDHTGDLAGAIELMEAAFAKVDSTNKTGLYCWALSNLGDMYGHAGRIAESYAAYLRVLQKDPSYVYALNGIAWIAYAHDNNPAEAKRILHFVKSVTDDPSVYLNLAEIAAYEKDVVQQKTYMDQFKATVANPAYGDMYNTHLIELFTEEKVDLEKAMQLAKKEVANRATPETYAWLAWVHYKKGEIGKAHQIFTTSIKGRIFEPDILLKGACIMEAAGKQREAKAYFKECIASSFELGPVTTSEIAGKLN